MEMPHKTGESVSSAYKQFLVDMTLDKSNSNLRSPDVTGHWERKNAKIFAHYIVVKSGSIYINNAQHQSSANSTHKSKHISPAETYNFLRYLSCFEK